MTGDPVGKASPEDKNSGRFSPKARDKAQWWRLDTTASTVRFERMARDALSRTPRGGRYANGVAPAARAQAARRQQRPSGSLLNGDTGPAFGTSACEGADKTLT